ncbi:MAG: AMP-binding protein [Sandaracinaceae bacterium]
MGLSFEGWARPSDRLALEASDGALTQRGLVQACARHVDALAEAGVKAGDRVAVWTQPALATGVALAAHAAAGIVSVPLNPKLAPRELAHILSDAQPKLTLAAEPTLVAGDAQRVDVDASGSAALSDEPSDDDRPLLLLYTSGTTGPPKGAVITARNVAFDLDALARAWGWTEGDTVVHALPLFHVHGLVLGLFGSLRVGGALAWQGKFDPASLAARLGAGGPTMLFSVPTMVHRIADVAESDAGVRAGLRAARLLISGSAGLPVREHRRIEALTDRGVLERYGLTETLINTAVRAASGAHPGYVGPPLDGVELALVDEQGTFLGVHDDATIAEVAVRGPNVFAGYLDRPDATAAVLDERGWFKTGDLATRAADGSIRIVGRRATDLIKTGGFKVGAGEVEAALLEHPSVAEAAVVGVPDDDLGERIVAFVVLRDGADDDVAAIGEHAASLLSAHKRPREVRAVAELPKNAMGKVQKKRLREG